MVVEDGTGLVDSNSYVSLEYADDYFSTRSVSSWSELTDDQKKALLVKGTDYIDSVFKWKGVKSTPTQSLNFPRKDLIDDNGYKVEGIPNCLKVAVCESALVLSSGTEMFKTESENGAVTSEHIGQLSFTYDVAQKIKDSTVYESINSRLRGLYEDTTKTRIYTGNVSRV